VGRDGRGGGDVDDGAPRGVQAGESSRRAPAGVVRTVRAVRKTSHPVQSSGGSSEAARARHPGACKQVMVHGARPRAGEPSRRAPAGVVRTVRAVRKTSHPVQSSGGSSEAARASHPGACKQVRVHGARPRAGEPSRRAPAGVVRTVRAVRKTSRPVRSRLSSCWLWLSRTASIGGRSEAGPVDLWEEVPQPKLGRSPGGANVGSVSSRRLPVSTRVVGPPMWGIRRSLMRLLPSGSGQGASRETVRMPRRPPLPGV